MSRLASNPSKPVASTIGRTSGNERASDADATPVDQPSAEAARERGWNVGRLLSRQTVAVLLAASIGLNAVGFAVVASSRRQGETGRPSAEYPLGVYRYLGNRFEPGRVASAEFTLHAAASPEYGLQGLQVLEAHKFRLRQGIEELLRRISPKEFDDIGLRQLKRSIRSRIEEILDGRLVDDVIITDLVIRWKPLGDYPAESDRLSDQAEVGQLSQAPHDSTPSQQ